jgi:hypothetical protein
LSFPKGICVCLCRCLFPSTKRKKIVIPTEAVHSLIVSGAVEGSPHFAFALVVAVAIACPFVCHSRRESAFAFAVACPFASRPTKNLRLLSPLQGFNP